MSTRNPKVDAYFNKAKKWQTELELLRKIILSCQLTEELKWGVPCYMYKTDNVFLIHTFKEYCAITFFKGVLLQDSENILIQQTKNTQSARQIRYSNALEIVESEAVLKAYIYEAIEVEKAGLQVTLKPKEDYTMPEELRYKLDKMPEFKLAFESLTPGRQKGYLLFFSEAKQSKTRESRIESNIQRILNGKGLNDCTCGLSKRMPSCDGSHKFLRTASN